MLFAIDETKVEELCKSSEPGYTVTVAPGGTPVALTSENYSSFCYDSSWIAGTVAYAPSLAATEETREQLVAIRKRIEKSGAPLKSADALARELERMRRR